MEESNNLQFIKHIQNRRRNSNEYRTVFSKIMDICDWDRAGNDKEILSPLIEYLSCQSDDEIYSFDDIMAELLYGLDTKKNFKTACKYYDHSDDTFLYSRCVALINGADYYKKAQQVKVKDLWTSEFEAILYVPQAAWAKSMTAIRMTIPI